MLFRSPLVTGDLWAPRRQSRGRGGGTPIVNSGHPMPRLATMWPRRVAGSQLHPTLSPGLLASSSLWIRFLLRVHGVRTGAFTCTLSQNVGIGRKSTESSTVTGAGAQPSVCRTILYCNFEFHSAREELRTSQHILARPILLRLRRCHARVSHGEPVSTAPSQTSLTISTREGSGGFGRF